MKDSGCMVQVLRLSPRLRQFTRVLLAAWSHRARAAFFTDITAPKGIHVSFQDGDRVRFRVGGGAFEGVVSGREGREYLIHYTGLLPRAFREASSVRITKSDLAVKNGDLHVQEGDLSRL